MAQAQAAFFKFGGGTVAGARRKAVGAVAQLGFSTEHFKHLLRVGFPSGRAMNIAPWGQPADQLR